MTFKLNLYASNRIKYLFKLLILLLWSSGFWKLWLECIREFLWIWISSHLRWTWDYLYDALGISSGSSGTASVNSASLQIGPVPFSSTFGSFVGQFQEVQGLSLEKRLSISSCDETADLKSLTVKQVICLFQGVFNRKNIQEKKFV